jgi:hypothetical protein
MPTPTLRLGSEIVLEHRGYRVFHVYRADEFPDRLQHVFSFSPEEDDLGWQFDVRELPGAGDSPDDPAGLIQEAIDRCLDRGEPFPFDPEARPLPSGSDRLPKEDLPDDWDLLDFLEAVNRRRDPMTKPLQERHIAGALRLVDLLAELDSAQHQRLEQWLRTAQSRRQP